MHIERSVPGAILIFVLLLGTAVGNRLPAQQMQSEATAQAAANLIADGLTVINLHDLTFGPVLQNSGTRTVAIGDAVPGGAHAARFRIIGQVVHWSFFFITIGSFVDISHSPPAELTNGTNTIPFTPAAAYNNDPLNGNQPGGAVSMNPGGVTRVRFLGPNNTTGNIYVWVYGSIDVGDVPPGEYTGSYTITCEYGIGLF
jgi:hypothetical protein